MVSGFSGTREVVIVVIIGAMIGLPIVAYWKIFSKAGFSGWLGLTQLVPLVNVAVLFYLAFAEWPLHRELNDLKQRSGGSI